MPKAPAKLCSRHQLIYLNKCGKCQNEQMTKRRARDRARPTAHDRGYNSQWIKESKSFLKDYPYCVTCKKTGLWTKAKVVDHIKPHHQNMNLFWDKLNWQPLCKACHDSKTAREDGGYKYIRG